MSVFFLICFIFKKITIILWSLKNYIRLNYFHKILFMTLVLTLYRIVYFNILFPGVQNLIDIEDIPEVIVTEDIKMK